MTAENILNSIISMIGVVYILILFFFGVSTLKEFITISITAFIMVITILLLGKFMFGVY